MISLYTNVKISAMTQNYLSELNALTAAKLMFGIKRSWGNVKIATLTYEFPNVNSVMKFS